MSWEDFPMIMCPHCGEEVQIDDYYEFSAGDTFDCPDCEETVYIWATDTTLSADVQVIPEPKGLGL